MSSPKFKVTIAGVKVGHNPERVKKDLMGALSADEVQVAELLANQAPVSKKILEHADAWKVKTSLQELGVDCQISPMPLLGLSERAGTLTIKGSEIEKNAPPRPQVVRRADHSLAMRSGKASTNSKVKKSAPKVGVLQVAALVGAILVTAWMMESNPLGMLQTSHKVASMADITD